MAGELALELPVVAVGVEDSVAEEVTEGAVECGALVVGWEVGFEDVLDDGGVDREDLAGAERVAEGEGGGGRGGEEDVGDPVDAAVLVGDDGEDGTNDRVSFGNIGVWCVFGSWRMG